MRSLTALTCLFIIIFVTPSRAWNQAGCSATKYSASEISNAIQNSPNANSTLKNASCEFGGAGVAESGGNTCETNGNNFGVLQLTSSNLPSGITADQYLNMPLQQQVDVWAKQVGNSNTTGGYKTLQANSDIGGTPVTAGMMGACFQFGPLICKNDINFMQQNGGQCPNASNGGVRATNSTLRAGTANMDGNSQSICTWGKTIQAKINQAAATCNKKVSNNCPLGPGDFSKPTTPVAAAAPAPSATDVYVASGQV